MDRGNRILEQNVAILKDANAVSEFIIALYSSSLSKEEINLVISVFLSKLADEDSFSLVLVFC